MIRYVDDLYLTENTKKNLSKIKRKLRLGAGILSLYVIMMSESVEDVFDIVPAQMFKIRKYRHMDHTVIGLAESEREAYGMIEKLIAAHYERTGQYTGLKAGYLDYFGISSPVNRAPRNEVTDA